MAGRGGVMTRTKPKRRTGPRSGTQTQTQGRAHANGAAGSERLIARERLPAYATMRGIVDGLITKLGCSIWEALYRLHSQGQVRVSLPQLAAAIGSRALPRVRDQLKVMARAEILTFEGGNIALTDFGQAAWGEFFAEFLPT